jgi:hypothetical protein
MPYAMPCRAMLRCYELSWAVVFYASRSTLETQGAQRLQQKCVDKLHVKGLGGAKGVVTFEMITYASYNSSKSLVVQHNIFLECAKDCKLIL